jgi:hypothetical protein
MREEPNKQIAATQLNPYNPHKTTNVTLTIPTATFTNEKAAKDIHITPNNKKPYLSDMTRIGDIALSQDFPVGTQPWGFLIIYLYKPMHRTQLIKDPKIKKAE